MPHSASSKLRVLLWTAIAIGSAIALGFYWHLEHPSAPPDTTVRFLHPSPPTSTPPSPPPPPQHRVAATLPAIDWGDANIKADDVYQAVLYYWARGDQAGAEHVLEEASTLFSDDIKLAFFKAACTRSRFEIDDSTPQFLAIARRTSDAYGKASQYIAGIDQQISVESNFSKLFMLSINNPDEPIVLWMVAVQCRALRKNDLGVERYTRLLQMIDPGPGPVLIHQSFANILDDLNRPNEALPHRLLAVKLEPEYWSYDGLGSTLTNLKRWDEADAAYERSTSLAPQMPFVWHNWALSKQARGDTAGYEKLIQKEDAVKKENGE